MEIRRKGDERCGSRGEMQSDRYLPRCRLRRELQGGCWLSRIGPRIRGLTTFHPQPLRAPGQWGLDSRHSLFRTERRRRQGLRRVTQGGMGELSSQRVQGTVVGALTVGLFPVQCSTDVWRERCEHNSPPTTRPGAIGPSMVDRTKNGVDRSVDVR